MIPILYERTEEEFNTSGFGRLKDAISCTVTEELNGGFELELVYPITGTHFDEIQIGRLIYAQPASGTVAQPFRVYRIQKAMSGTRATVNAEHVSYQVGSIPVLPFVAHTAAEAMTMMAENAQTDWPFLAGTDIVKNATLDTDVPHTARELMNSDYIVGVYGGEWMYDGWNIHLLKRRGENKTDVVIRYGKNLTDLTHDVDATDIRTAVLPYWRGSVENDAGEYETKTIYASPKIVTSTNTAATLAEIPYYKTDIVDITSYFGTDEVPTAEGVRVAGMQELAKRTTAAARGVTLSFVPLDKTEEYKAMMARWTNRETVNLGDTITVINEKIGVNEWVRVNKTVFDVIREKYNSIDVGVAKITLNDILGKSGGISKEYLKTLTVAKSAQKAAAEALAAANTAQETASSVRGIADSASSSASSAASTAASAASTAASAQSTANSARSAALSAQSSISSLEGRVAALEAGGGNTAVFG